jgi:hypothetical protein
MKILFLNHTKKQCGVYQYGVRLYSILKNTTEIEYNYQELSSYDEYKLIDHNIYNAIIYNYHNSTMSWLNKNNIFANVNICIPHESDASFFDIICSIDPDEIEIDNKYAIPRPLYENIDKILLDNIYSSAENKNFIESYTQDNIPIFGSFGFGFLNKGFDKIIKIINDNYDEAIIKFIIPVADFDPNSNNTNTILDNICLSIKKKEKIKLLITHNFFSNEEILKFLGSNTLNIFLYDYMHSRGISSVTDYALSVKTPLAISDSHMFKHIYSDSICLYKTSIFNIIKNSSEYCEKFRINFSNENLRNKFKTIVKNITKHKINFSLKYSNSQVCQDLFACVVCNTNNGFFLEIGSNHPVNSNNTYLLEKYYGWKGLMVEFDNSFLPLYEQYRKNSIYCMQDARNVNYRGILDNNNFPVHINYLQIDLDVDNCSTLETLQLLNETVFDKYKFSTITFEHDIYAGNFFNTREISRKIFKERGYVLVFPDVLVYWLGGYKPFEDWYVHPDLVDEQIIKKLKTDTSVNVEDIKQKLMNLH